MDKDQTQKRPSLHLTNDFVFKAFFTYDSDQDRRMLEALTTQLIRSRYAPNDQGKDIRLDVSAQFIPRAYLNLEMQTSKMQIENRAVYYASMLLTQQENKGLHYSDLMPVIQVFFLDYLFPPKEHFSDKAIHAYQFQEIDDHDCLTNLMTIYIIEIAKIIQVKHSYDELNEIEQWLWFIKYYNDELSDPIVAELVRRQDIFKEAHEIMNAISNDPVIRDAAYACDKELRDRAQTKYEGKAEGIEIGKELGIEQGNLDVARSLLRKHLNDDLIIECTKVTTEQLVKLKLELNSMMINTKK